jgi:molybdopterin/thiamine biosynthesis adenylyltransferase
MDAQAVGGGDWSLRMSQALHEDLHAHLFPGDGGEHGAVIEAGLATLGGRQVLLARRLWKAQDGVDWLPGTRGYRMLPASYVTKRIRECRAERLVYLAVHNHGGRSSVEFSKVDLATHERGFPALLDVMKGVPVGALVFAEDAVAGDIWTTDGGRHALQGAVVVGPTRRRLTPASDGAAVLTDPRFDRQVRLFGAGGQAVLGNTRVAIIGVGGVGILLAEYLGRLGVGEIVVVDPDHVDPTNLPRMVDATGWDAMSWLVAPERPAWVRALGRRMATSKVRLAARVIHKANPRARVLPFRTDMENPAALEAIKGCDYVFLAADSHRARLLFNALVHQFLVPGAQLGSRIRSDAATGAVEHVHTVTRWVLPDCGCLVCNQQINPARLQEESVSASMRTRQKYTDDPDVVAPSVITLNAMTAAQAANDFLFYITGLARPDAFNGYVRFHPLLRRLEMLLPRKDESCPDCGVTSDSRFGRGDTVALPLVD